MEIKIIQQPKAPLATNTEDTFHVGVKVIIKSNGTILLVKTKRYWDLPGGRIQVSEHPEATARREVAEETGITDLGPLDHLTIITSSIRIPIKDKQSVGLLFSFYTATLANNPPILLSPEHVAYEWIAPETAYELLKVSYGQDIQMDFFL